MTDPYLDFSYGALVSVAETRRWKMRPTLSCTELAYGEPVKSTLGAKSNH